MAQIETKWGTPALSELIGSEITDAVSAIDSVVGTLGDAIAVVTTALEAALLTRSADVDLAAQALKAVIAAIDKALELFDETELGMTWVIPKSYRQADTVEGTLAKVAQSYYDKTDDERPQAKSSETYFASYIVIATMDSLQELIDLFKPFMELFGIPIEFEVMSDEEIRERATTASFGGQGMAPDWRSLKLSELGVLSVPVQFLKNAKASLTMAESQVDFIKKAIGVIKKRLDKITGQIDDVLKVTDVLAATANAADVFSLSVYGQGDTRSQTQALRNAHLLSGAPKGKISACIVLHMQPSTKPALDALVTLLRMNDE